MQWHMDFRRRSVFVDTNERCYVIIFSWIHYHLSTALNVVRPVYIFRRRIMIPRSKHTQTRLHCHKLIVNGYVSSLVDIWWEMTLHLCNLLNCASYFSSLIFYYLITCICILHIHHFILIFFEFLMHIN